MDLVNDTIQQTRPVERGLATDFEESHTFLRGSNQEETDECIATSARETVSFALIKLRQQNVLTSRRRSMTKVDPIVPQSSLQGTKIK